MTFIAPIRHVISYYCAGHRCLRTTDRIVVRMNGRTYYYCIRCGHRLEKV